MENKMGIVAIFPYLGLNKILKMGDFEIHPFDSFDFKKFINNNEYQENLLNFRESFRKSIFNKGEMPEMATGCGILLYRGDIFLKEEDNEDIFQKKDLLFLLLKLHLVHDFGNPRLSTIKFEFFEIFFINITSNYVMKFNNLWTSDKLYTTVPRGSKGLEDIIFYPLPYVFNDIPVEFKIFKGGSVLFGVDDSITDLSVIFDKIVSNGCLEKLNTIAVLYRLLEEQTDIFLYYSIIPSILEVFFGINQANNSKKLDIINFGKELDKRLIDANDIQNVITGTGRNNRIYRDNLGVIARVFLQVYNTRNDLLHEGKRKLADIYIMINNEKVYIYNIFQLIIKYMILDFLIENKCIENKFIKVVFEGGNFYEGGEIVVKQISSSSLKMDFELNNLLDYTSFYNKD